MDVGIPVLYTSVFAGRVTFMQVGRPGSVPRMDRDGGRVKRRRQLLGLICWWEIRLYGWLASGGGSGGEEEEEDVEEQDLEEEEEEDWGFGFVRPKIVPPIPTPTPAPTPSDEEAGGALDPIAVVTTAFDDSIATVIPIVAVRMIPMLGVTLCRYCRRVVVDSNHTVLEDGNAFV